MGSRIFYMLRQVTLYYNYYFHHHQHIFWTYLFYCFSPPHTHIISAAFQLTLRTDTCAANSTLSYADGASFHCTPPTPNHQPSTHPLHTCNIITNLRPFPMPYNYVPSLESLLLMSTRLWKKKLLCLSKII